MNTTNYNIAHTYFNNIIQLIIYKFYEWKQISRTSVTLQHEFMECNFGNS